MVENKPKFNQLGFLFVFSMDVNDDMKKVEQLSAVKVSDQSILCCFLHANILNCSIIIYFQQ